MQKSLQVSTRCHYLILINENPVFQYQISAFVTSLRKKACTLWPHFSKNVLNVACKGIFNSNASSSLDTLTRNTNCLPSGTAHVVLLLLPKLDGAHEPFYCIKSNSNSKKKATGPAQEQNCKVDMAVSA